MVTSLCATLRPAPSGARLGVIVLLCHHLTIPGQALLNFKLVRAAYCGPFSQLTLGLLSSVRSQRKLN